MNEARNFLAWIFKQKYKIALISFLTSVFLLILFPYGDLSDLVTSIVAKNTNNQVYVKFENASVSLVPAGLKLEKPLLETSTLPSLEADLLTFSPNLKSIIFKKPGGSIVAENFWGGNIAGSLSPGPTSEAGNETSKISFEGKSVNLERVMDFFNSPVRLQGRADIVTSGSLQLAFLEQPDLDLDLRVSGFNFLTSQVNTGQLGSVILPEFKLSVASLKGRLSGGQLLISQATLGSAQEEMFGQIKGKLALNIINQRGRFYPEIGEYNFDVDLTLKSQLHEKLSLFLFLASGYKTDTPTGSRYRFKISGVGPAGVPSFSKLQ